MQQCLKCKTWVESKDMTTGGCVNCNSSSVISTGIIHDPGEHMWAEWDKKVQEAAEIIQLLCATRRDTKKGCKGCPMSAGEGCITGYPGLKPRDWHTINRFPSEVPDDTNVNFNYVPDNMWKDELGGYHGEGIGYNPQGVFCGECTQETCEGCEHRDAVK